MTKEEIHLFRGFLEMHGVWGEFVREFYKPEAYIWRKDHVRGNVTHSLESFLHCITHEKATDSAFCWSMAKSGHTMWFKLDEWWKQACRRI